jgi:hypothetical protein
MVFIGCYVCELGKRRVKVQVKNGERREKRLLNLARASSEGHIAHTGE